MYWTLSLHTDDRGETFFNSNVTPMKALRPFKTTRFSGLFLLFPCGRQECFSRGLASQASNAKPDWGRYRALRQRLLAEAQELNHDWRQATAEAFAPGTAKDSTETRPSWLRGEAPKGNTSFSPCFQQYNSFVRHCIWKLKTYETHSAATQACYCLWRGTVPEHWYSVFWQGLNPLLNDVGRRVLGWNKGNVNSNVDAHGRYLYSWMSLLCHKNQPQSTPTWWRRTSSCCWSY